MSGLSGRRTSGMLGALAIGAMVVCGAQAQMGNMSCKPAVGSSAQQAHPLAHMSHEAARIFNDVGMAQTALNNGNNAKALQDIHSAMMVRNRLAMTARSNNLPKVVPIYSDLEENTTLGPILAQKNNGKPMPPMGQPVAVDAVADQFTFVGIDLDKTKQRLQGAADAIKNNNIQSAEDTLSAIGDDLVVAKVSADAPLLAIRENLAIAQIAAGKHQPREATTALQQASDELTAYSQNSSYAHAADAAQLNTGVKQMLSVSGQKTPAAAAKISMWWNQVNNWMQGPPA